MANPIKIIKLNTNDYKRLVEAVNPSTGEHYAITINGKQYTWSKDVLYNVTSDIYKGTVLDETTGTPVTLVPEVTELQTGLIRERADRTTSESTITNNLNSVANRVTVTESGISTLTTEVSDISDDLIETKCTLATTVTDLGNTKTDLNTTKTNLTNEIARATGIEEGIKTRVTAAETGLGEVTTTTNRHEGNISVLQQSSDKLMSAVYDGETDKVAKVTQTANKVETAVFDGTTNRIATLTTRADGIDATVTTLDTKITAVKVTADDVTATVMDEDTGLAAVRVTANTVTSTVQDLTKEGGRISQIEQNADSISVRVGDVETWKTNEAATKDFVNSSIASNTGELKGNFDIVEDLKLPYTATNDEIAAALKTKITSAKNNDYCYVKTKDGQNDCIKRFKYTSNGTKWVYEYTLNNSSFTAAQWAAINSGVDAGKITAYNNYSTQISALDVKADGIETRVGTVEGNIVTIQDDLGDVEDTVATHTTTLSNHATQISGIDQRTDTISATVGEHTTAISSQATAIAGKNSVTKGDTIPTNPTVGDLWFYTGSQGYEDVGDIILATLTTKASYIGYYVLNNTTYILVTSANHNNLNIEPATTRAYKINGKKTNKWYTWNGTDWAETTDSTIVETKDNVSNLAITTDNITSRVSATETNIKDNYYTKTTTDSKISQSATGILSTVEATYETQTASESKRSNLQSQINQQSTEIAAKVSETGGDGTTENSFGWSLKTDGFKLKSNGTEVFSVDKAGNTILAGNLTIGGYAKNSDVSEAKQAAIDAAATDATTKANTAQTTAVTHANTEIAKEKVRAEGIEADIRGIATTAQSDATIAKSNAEAAISTATAAGTAANSAYTLADGKSKTTYSDAVPANPKSGDCWFCTKDILGLKATQLVVGQSYYLVLTTSDSLTAKNQYVYFSDYSNVDTSLASDTGLYAKGYANTFGKIGSGYYGFAITNATSSTLGYKFCDTTGGKVLGNFKARFIYKSSSGSISELLNFIYSISYNKDTLYQYNGSSWIDIGGNLVANKVTANYIESKKITAKKVNVLDSNNQPLFTADGEASTPYVYIAGFNVEKGNINNVESQSGEHIGEVKGIYIGTESKPVTINNFFRSNEALQESTISGAMTAKVIVEADSVTIQPTSWTKNGTTTGAGGTITPITNGGCFEANTRVTMADGTYKNIIDIIAGDFILSYNETTKTFEPKEVLSCHKFIRNDGLLTIKFQDDTELHTTIDHPILGKAGWKSLEKEANYVNDGNHLILTKLEIGDIIMSYSGQCKHITGLEVSTVDATHYVYNLTIADNHTFIAEDIITHNIIVGGGISKSIVKAN